MRIAIVSDIHGNRAAFEAVEADVRAAAPDLVLHGGDLSDGGSSPAWIVDRVRELGWSGVMGNGDEMCVRPEPLEEFARQSSAPPALWDAVREMADWTRSALGAERISWLAGLPRLLRTGSLALVHASPDDLWRAPLDDAGLEAACGRLDADTVVFGHTHRPFTRRLASGVHVANSGSVGLPYNGDRRASYVLIDEGTPAIRRVEYDLDAEAAAIRDNGLPHGAWVEEMLRAAAPRLPR